MPGPMLFFLTPVSQLVYLWYLCTNHKKVPFPQDILLPSAENCQDKYINLHNKEYISLLCYWHPFGLRTLCSAQPIQLYMVILPSLCSSFTGGGFLAPQPLSLLPAQTFGARPHSLQLRSSDWSSQSASPSQCQPALMHRPLSHMNSPERQGWWEAGET